MESVHVCPHCGNAVDTIGENYLKEKRKKKDEAERKWSELAEQNWFLRNFHRTLCYVAVVYAAIACCIILFQPDEWGGYPGVVVILSVIPTIFVLAVAKHINCREVERKFIAKYSQAEYYELG